MMLQGSAFNQYKKAFQVSPLPQAFYCLKEDKWLEVNQAFLQMLGYSESSLKKKTYKDITHPEDLKVSQESVKQIISGEIDNFQKVKRYFHANKSIVYGKVFVHVVRDNKHEPLFVISQVQNITEEVLATRNLSEKEKQLQLVVDTVYDGFWDWHLDADYEYMSPRFWEILGYKASEKKHHPSEWQKLIFEEDLKIALKNFDLHVKTRGEYPFYQEVRYTHKKGHAVWVLCKGEVVEWGKNGEPLRMVGSHTDITELKKSQEKLVHGSKMIALGEMAGGIAHEINTPLAVISSHSYNAKELLKSSKIDLAQINESIDKINSTVSRITNVVENLLSFSRNDLNQEERRVSSLDIVLMQVIGLCNERFIGNQIVFEKSLDFVGSDEVLIGDELSQVLLNVLNNAFYAVKDLKKEKRIKLSVESCGEFFEIKIQDNGVGISKNIQDKIMDPFFTTKSANEGTGLGLSISKSLIEKNHGKIEFKSRPGHTEFSIFVLKKRQHKSSEYVDLNH